MLSGIGDLKFKYIKTEVNAPGYYSLAPRKSAAWHANCAQMVEKKAIHPL
jgi:hypothetical protein